MKKPEISIGNVRWIMYPRNGKPIVENLQHGKTWKKCYKDNYKNIDALCFQLIPEGVKHFIDPSPLNEYWVFDEFVYQVGGAGQHISRNICSLQETNKWLVLTINNYKETTKSYMTSEEVGYQSLTFLNAEEKLWK